MQLNSLGLESLKHLERAFFPLGDMVFISTLLQTKARRLASERRGGKTNSERVPLTSLLTFQTTNGDVLTDKNGWIYGKATGRGMGSRRCGSSTPRPAMCPHHGARAGRSVPRGSRSVFLHSSLDSSSRTGGLSFLSAELLLPWKRPFWPLRGLITFLKVFRSCEFLE